MVIKKFRQKRRSLPMQLRSSTITGVECTVLDSVNADPYVYLWNIIPGYGGSQLDQVINCFSLATPTKMILEWVPSLSLASNGRINFQIITNPEVVALNNTALTAANAVSYMANSNLVMSKPVSRGFKWDITKMLHRRSWYETDYTPTTTDIGNMDRSCMFQLVVTMVDTGISTTTKTGMVKIHTTYSLKDMKSSAQT